MPISIDESTSTRKSIDLAVVPSATGLTVSGSVRWFAERFDIAPTVIPCTYVEDQSYRVALCRSVGGPVLALVDEDGIPAGYEEVCSPIRFRFATPTDTCATVAIEVTKRTLVGELPEPSIVVVSTTPVLPADDAGKVAGRKVRARIRDLTQQARALKQAGTTYSAMSAAQRQIINELVALLSDSVPLAVP